MQRNPLLPFRSKPSAPKERKSNQIKVGRFRRALGWLCTPAALWIGTSTIRDSATFTGDMIRRVRAKPLHNPRFHLAEDGRSDLAEIGCSLGLSAVELELRSRVRRRQTALAAYLLCGLGLVLFLIWLVQIVGTPLTAGRLVLALEFFPACLMCVLLGFHRALLNFQIRTGRAANWRKFLTTDQGFWPSL